MARPRNPQIAIALDKVMSGRPVADVAAEMGLDRTHIYRRLRAEGLKPPARNKRGRKALILASGTGAS